MAVKTLEKNSLLKYFEILKDKIFKIMLLNIIFFTVLSLLIFASMGINYLVNMIFGQVYDFWAMFTFLPLIFLGPVTAAIMKMMRDYVREEPGFFLEDLKRAFKVNFKQSLIIGIIQYFVAWFIFIAIRFYYSGLEGGFFYTLGLGISIFVAIAFTVASYYLYMMTVTLKLKVKEIIKNSLIFTLLCLGKNILLTIVLVIWIAINLMLTYLAIISGTGLVYGLVIAVYMVLTFGIIFYTIAFFTFPSIKKHILDPYYEEHPEETSKSVLDKPKADEIDFNAVEKEKELPEFVYHNGKMVHRSALEEKSVFSDERLSSDDVD